MFCVRLKVKSTYVCVFGLVTLTKYFVCIIFYIYTN